VARAAPPGGAVAPASSSAPAAAEEKDEKGGGEGLSVADAERLCEFLRADLPHLFDDVGIDRSAYDDRVRFRDPITRHDTIDGYLFNIRLLKLLFRPDFYLHAVKQVRRARLWRGRGGILRPWRLLTVLNLVLDRAVRAHHEVDHGDEVYAPAMEAGAGLHRAVDNGPQPAESQVQQPCGKHCCLSSRDKDSGPVCLPMRLYNPA
jgi:hypothetical protein